MSEERCLEQCAVLQTRKLRHIISEGHCNVLTGLNMRLFSTFRLLSRVCIGQARCTISALLNVLPHRKNQCIEYMYVFMYGHHIVEYGSTV